MTTLFSSGFKISSLDKKALENDLLVTPQKWIQDALNGMINKAVKTLLRNHLEEYKKTCASLDTDYKDLIPKLLTSPSYVPSSKLSLSESITLNRKEATTIEILPEGLTIEPWQAMALNAYYENYQEHLQWLINNKINACRKRFVKEWQEKFFKSKELKTIPSDEDEMITLAVAHKDYKNRQTREAEALANRSS